MQETCAYREDTKALTRWKMTPDQMHEQVARAYAQQAALMGIRLIPTGHAVQLARKTQKQPLVLPTEQDIAKYTYPQRLPEDPGALHTGYIWRARKAPDGTSTYRTVLDGAHLNTRGKYLQACTWYGFLFQKPVSNITFVPNGLDPQDALSSDSAPSRPWIPSDNPSPAAGRRGSGSLSIPETDRTAG